MDVVSDRLLSERTELSRRVEYTLQAVEEDKDKDGRARDLTDNERKSLEQLHNRIAAIDEQLNITTRDYALGADLAQRIAKVNGQQVVSDDAVQWRTAGEVLWDYLNQNNDTRARERVKQFTKVQTRAAEHMGTSAAVTVPTAGGFGGVIVSPVLGPVIDLAWGGMPLVTTLGAAESANPATFMRPRLVDPNIDSAGPQAGGKEKAELPSKKFDVIADAVSLSLIGNYLNLSLQAESLVAGALDLVISQLTKRTSRGIERAGVAELEKATKKVTLDVDATSAEVLRAVYDAAALVYLATGEMASWIAMGPLGMAQLGGIADLAGRPLFPGVGANNAPGTSTANGFTSTVAGLAPIVTPGIADTKLYVGNSVGLEFYLHRFPVLQAVEPSVLGRQIAVAASFGSYRVPTTEAVTGGSPSPALYEAVVVLAP